jgi:anti-sigma regulatory factor (Ser/Thr protein kinase)
MTFLAGTAVPVNRPMVYSQSFPKTPSAAAQAREMLAQLDPPLPGGMFENARLLTSELVANAVEHGGSAGDVEVRIALGDANLRVEVYDDGPGFEWVPREADTGKERGWGLHFTHVVASRWAVERGERTCVWFELDLQS